MSQSEDDNGSDYEYNSDDGEEEDHTYDYEDEDRYEDNASPRESKGTSSSRAFVPFRIIGYDTVSELVKSTVKNVANVLDVEADQAQVLLTHIRWDEEKLIRLFFDNPEKLCQEAGIDKLDMVTLKQDLNNNGRRPEFLCKICYDDAATEGFGLGCGHKFCVDCYGSYLHNQVSEGPLCVTAHCPEFKCNQAVPPALFQKILNAQDKATYDRYALRQFIEANKSYRYCPAPNCERISVGCGETHVLCECGHNYCFHCAEEDHRPCNCATLSKWTDKCNNDSETANWMTVNTKPCPKCVTRIEKNQGCNHMTCRQCRHEFCWLCFGDWKSHSTCNRFTGAAGQEGLEDTIMKKKLDLERYMHYYKRFQNHEIALKFAEKQRAKLAQQLQQLQEQDHLALQDVQCVKDAAEQVILCRRVLKYTYVMGYYMDDKAPTRQLFERHQEMLEENTERLQEYIELKNLKSLDRMQLINCTRITEKFRNSLLDDINDEATLEVTKPAPLPPPPAKATRKTSRGEATTTSSATASATVTTTAGDGDAGGGTGGGLVGRLGRALFRPRNAAGGTEDAAAAPRVTRSRSGGIPEAVAGAATTTGTIGTAGVATRSRSSGAAPV